MSLFLVLQMVITLIEAQDFCVTKVNKGQPDHTLLGTRLNPFSGYREVFR